MSKATHKRTNKIQVKKEEIGLNIRGMKRKHFKDS
jgi:hypothetical protein